MMAALDGEVSDVERGELDALLEGDPELREEWHRMSQVKEVTSTMAFRKPPEEVWGRYWTSVYNRMERGVGWILASIGAVVIMAYGLWKWFETLYAEAGLPWFVKAAIMLLSVGFLIVFVSVVREKLFTRRYDAYKEIER
jgi:hypothetical protein